MNLGRAGSGCVEAVPTEKVECARFRWRNNTGSAEWLLLGRVGKFHRGEVASDLPLSTE